MDHKFVVDRTILIAKILSMYFFVTGLGFVFSGDFFNQMIAHTGSDPVLINLSGMVHFFIGSTILTIHFLWKNPLQIIITLLGIMFFIKGIFLIAIPELILQTGNNPAHQTWVMALGFIAAGTFLGYFAFINKNKDS